MKFRFGWIVIVFLSFQSSSSLPENSWDALFDNVTQWIQDLENGLMTVVSEVAKDAIVNGKEFTELVKNRTEFYLKEAVIFRKEYNEKLKEFFEENVNSFDSFLASLLKSLENKISTTHQKFKKDFIKDVKNVLNSLNQQIVSFRNKTNDIQERIADNIETTELEIQKDWNLFAADLLDHVANRTDDNEESLDKAEDLIDEFINRYSNYINSCALEFEDAVDVYSPEINNMIFERENAIRKLVEKLDSCLKDRKKRVASKCLAEVKIDLVYLQSLPNHFDEIGAEIENLVSSGFAERSCTSQTLLEFDLEANKIRKSIEEIIATYKK